MKKSFYILFLLFFVIKPAFSQVDTTSVGLVDSLYKEDQFYFGISYNILNDMPEKMKQNGFSLGIQAGFIKDMPINKRRNLAIGVGVGYAFNTFNQNMGIFKSPQNEELYIILNEDYDFSYNRNNYYFHQVEAPIEFRWRTSTAESYRFWRIYTGFKLSYAFATITNIKAHGDNLRYTDIKGFNELQYGLTLSAGYNTWNFYVYYGLNSFFEKDVKTFVYNKDINTNVIQLGLIFYLL